MHNGYGLEAWLLEVRLSEYRRCLVWDKKAVSGMRKVILINFYIDYFL